MYILFEGIVLSILRLALWDEQLHYVQHAYNKAIRSSTQKSPFETCFGYFPKSPLDFDFRKDTMEYGKVDVDKPWNFIYKIHILGKI